MFDSTLCDRQFTEYSVFTDWVSLEIVNIILIAGLILAVFGLGFIVKNRRRKRRIIKSKAFLSIIGLTSTFVLLFVVVGKGLALPTDYSTAAQAIVILGRGPSQWENRINLAAELWQAKKAPEIFVSGRTEAREMIQLLEAQGIPSRVIDGENCSISTSENALFTAAILKPQGIDRIILITDAPHMWRSLFLFRDNGFTVIPYPSKLSNKWNLYKKAVLTLRESIYLVGYGLNKLFLRQPSAKINNPNLEKLLQQAEEYSKTR
ncbi:MAG TPA: hypothetical protein DDW76_29235 [Cyanobacteria bacterium UBA11369]|nr:hypothetical protein [Cyanobacteria bacterium UBA11371]HBE36064.1 hypothetical protein [Cyanobacteria bacterium UBA11368]HBE52746.1 hypothetical protein [Cyanobacteria bacterium UBA11369]